MSELKGPVIVIDDNTEATQSLLASFQSVGWECLSAKNLDDLKVICTDPLNQPVILTVQFLQNQSKEKFNYNHEILRVAPIAAEHNSSHCS